MLTPSLQRMIDKLAIGLSVACAIHCLLTPVVLLLAPMLAATPFGGEQFHIWMLIIVLPTSALAMLIGCRRHFHGAILMLAAAGFAFLVLGVFLGEMLWGAWGERGMTLLGSSLLVIAHIQNYRKCTEAGCDHAVTP